MNIITISREFGSGGRELGKKIAEKLGYDYYDREIITAIAERHGLDENYVEYALNNNIWQSIPLTFSHSFVSAVSISSPQTSLLLEQRKIIEEIAKADRNCVIVGRNADEVLYKHNPFNIFVCADMDAKIKRCKERATEGENLTDKQIKRKIQRIEKNRERTRYLISDKEWGHRKTYHIIVNTTDLDMDKLADSLVYTIKQFRP
jgi:cytidylate kinase